jgi:AcrR family transcriptional regulator
MPGSSRGHHSSRGRNTRAAIVDAAIYAHEHLGPSGSTLTAIANHAGVSRATIHHHFPDAFSLYVACVGTYNESHPLPDPAGWANPDPQSRLRDALNELYAFYSENERMFTSGMDAVATHPALGVALRPFLASIEAYEPILRAGWTGQAKSSKDMVSIAIHHALAFPTWRVLRRGQGVTNAQAVALMVGMVAEAARLRSAPG